MQCGRVGIVRSANSDGRSVRRSTRRWALRDRRFGWQNHGFRCRPGTGDRSRPRGRGRNCERGGECSSSSPTIADFGPRHRGPGCEFGRSQKQFRHRDNRTLPSRRVRSRVMAPRSSPSARRSIAIASKPGGLLKANRSRHSRNHLRSLPQVICIFRLVGRKASTGVGNWN
jgi:hypothetical protein